MPHGEDAAGTETPLVPPAKRSKVNSEEAAKSAEQQQVVWPVEDPSEYRPELGPDGDCHKWGKGKEEFRIFYEVRNQFAVLLNLFTPLLG